MRTPFKTIQNIFAGFSIKSVFFKYLSSSILSSLIGVFTGFFTYRYIEPALLGIWALFTVYEIYATFSRLGIINGLARELPYLLGMNETKQAETYASTALFYTLASNLLLFAFVPFLLSNQSFELQNNNYIYSLLVVLLKLLFSSYTSYLTVTFRTNKSFNDLSNIQNLLSIIRLLSLVLVILYGFLGLLIRELTMSFLEMLLFHLKRPLLIRPKFNLPSMFKLFKVGFPLFVVSYAFSFIDTLPRLYIINYGTLEQLGLFSPIIIILGLALLLPNAISSYMYPKMSYEYGQNQNKENVWRIVLLTAAASFVSGVPLFASVYFFAGYIDLIFPKYSPIIPYLKLASFSLLFIGYKSGGLSFAVIKSWWIMILNTIVYLIVTLLSLIILHFYFQDILQVASLTLVISFAFMFIFSIYLSYRVTHNHEDL